MADSIKIVVRVRPLNERELTQNEQVIVQMFDQQVRVNGPEGEVKKFAFHRCYWSTDDSLGKPPVDNSFVFNDIGKEILRHIFEGFNATIFAYGQTGAGKSYSIEGYEEKGLLQMCLDNIFNEKMAQNKKEGILTSVKVQYLEIYNEKLRDLLNPANEKEIKVVSAGDTVVIQNASMVGCETYDEVLQLFQDGKKIRVIGAHAMNKTSSRSHAVFTIYYEAVGKGKKVKSKFNIVDLAGSQRQSKTGATGKRLEEANNINKSLTNLGIVIEALAKNSEKKKHDFVPYRNSMLTHILSQSLAGNSKTFMIAAISPAKYNFQQTISTLRFAQRASLISTKTKKNVAGQGAQYNKALLEQIQNLKQQLSSAQAQYIHSHSHSVQYITIEDRLRAEQLEVKIKLMMEELQNNKSTMEELEKKLEEERQRKLEMEKNRNNALKQAGLSAGTETQSENQNLPYIMNISEDPTLAGMLIYHLREGEISIGTNQAEENDIKLNALGIMKRHCKIYNENGKIFVQPFEDCRLFINGIACLEKSRVNHLDRITLGHANTFKLVIPGEKTDLFQSVWRYGEYLDDRLNSDTPEAKNTKIFLQELQQRLDKSKFARFLDNFKSTYDDVDEANDYTSFRYKKYPLSDRNIHFRINVILDQQNYTNGEPTLIILCQHKDTKEIIYYWSEVKFQSRLAEMQSWYADSNSESQNTSTFYQFDPWFQATDYFIKQKEKLQVMNAKQIHDFLTKKQAENTERYKQLLLQQKQLLRKLEKMGASAQLVEDYGDLYFRNYEIPEKNKAKCQKLKKDGEVHSSIKRFMEICAQIQKCNLDNKAFNEKKNKYSHNSKKKEQEKTNNNKGGDNQGLMQQNAWMNQKIEQLTAQLKKSVKETQRLLKRHG